MKQLADGKMFTFRLSSYHFMQYLLIVFVSSGVIAKQTAKKCSDQGEYCLTHWDCCSNTCLSYLYRCARGHGVYPYPFLGISYKPTVTLEQILEQNFASPNALPDYQHQAKPYFVNRFGGAEENSAATEKDIVSQQLYEMTSETPIAKNTVDLKESSIMGENHLDSTTLKYSMGHPVDLTTLKTSIENHFDSTIELKEFSTATENYLGDEKTEAQTDGGLETTQEPLKRSSDKPSCAKIGEKCYYNEDCCEKLCHGYLHQCVT